MANTMQQGNNLNTPRVDTSASLAGAARWSVTRALLAFGAAGPVVFLAVATLAGLVRPDYEFRTRLISDLAVGANGWLMTLDFFMFGLSIVAFALGLFRALKRHTFVGTFLLLVVGGGIFASGLYPTDLKGAAVTDAGTIHNNLFLLVFLTFLIAYPFVAFALGKEGGLRGSAIGLALLPFAVLALLVVFIGFGSDPGDPLYAGAGLIQRLLIIVAFGWMTVVGRRLASR